MSFAIVEFFISFFLFNQFKSDYLWISFLLFLPLSLIGLGIRLGAFYTARNNFHHQIRFGEEPGHKLIRSGLYKYERHPGYLGFFIYSINCQFMILNFISGFLFIIILWIFFKRRILIEEKYLVKIFGEEYLNYMEKTRTNIPFIESYSYKEIYKRYIRMKKW